MHYVCTDDTLFLSSLTSRYTYVLGTSALSTIDNRQIRSSTRRRRSLVDRQTAELAVQIGHDNATFGHAIANLLAWISGGVGD